jgi:ribosomal protein S19
MSKRKNVRGRIAKAEKRLKKMRIVPEFVGTAMMSREGFVFVRIEGQE